MGLRRRPANDPVPMAVALGALFHELTVSEQRRWRQRAFNRIGSAL